MKQSRIEIRLDEASRLKKHFNIIDKLMVMTDLIDYVTRFIDLLPESVEVIEESVDDSAVILDLKLYDNDSERTLSVTFIPSPYNSHCYIEWQVSSKTMYQDVDDNQTLDFLSDYGQANFDGAQFPEEFNELLPVIKV